MKAAEVEVGTEVTSTTRVVSSVPVMCSGSAQ